MPETPAVNNGTLAANISRAIVQLIRDYTGRGPPQARTIINSDTVMVLLSDALTKGERKLIEHGKLDHVLQTRQQIQRIMYDDAVAIVESALDRKVIAFMSDNHAEPDIAAELFVLEREPETAPTERQAAQ
jgi:uncharacterized protein YbcI